MPRRLFPATIALASLLGAAGACEEDVAPRPSPRLGINLSSVSDYSAEIAFVDVFRSARPWVSQEPGKTWGKGPPLDLDENGWVKSLAPGCSADAVMLTIDTSYPAGRYSVYYEGRGKLEAKGSAKVVSDSPGRMVIEVGRKPKGNITILKIVATDPSNYVRNIRVLMPGVREADARKNPWNPKLLRLWRGIACIRFMDMMATNGSTVRTWGDRPKAEDATFGGRGVPVEMLCDLANRLDSDAWFCMPHLADDDYIRRFAKVVKDRLNPAHKAYIEYSNEVWNGGFPQSKYAGALGVKLGLGEKPWEGAWHYTAVRSVEIFGIWEEVFGGRDRLVRVLPSQAANAYVSKQILGFRDAARHADVLAIAPYLTVNVGPQTKPAAAEVSAWTVDQLLDYVETKVLPESERWIAESKRVADDHGLKLVAYEGGQHFVGIYGAENDQAMTKLMHSANASPRIGPIYDRYFAAWERHGGDLFCYFSSVTAWSKHGSWGLLQSLDENVNASPKWQATMRWARHLGQPVP